MRRLLLIALLLLPLGMKAQVIDTLIEMGVGTWLATPDTVRITDTVVRVDTVVQVRMDTVVQVRVDTVVHHITDTIIKRVADTAALSVLREKEAFYRQILNTSGVDKEKLEAERNYYIHMVDSLRAIVRISEIEAVRKEEANKYLLERARAAEERVAQATNRKKKVRPIQGIAMRFFRTPNWEVRLQPRADASGNYDGTYDKIVRNRNAGSFEFDFVTGASVMLWDLTPYFNKDHESKKIGETNLRTPELRRFDQDFAYDIGIYVGFGGSNLFKNFYIGPSFRFVDFFYLTVGVNIAEYEVLVAGYEDGQTIANALSVGDITAKSWLLKPFISMSVDLDFLSYIKR
jgi:hypothetical protein